MSGIVFVDVVHCLQKCTIKNYHTTQNFNGESHISGKKLKQLKAEVHLLTEWRKVLSSTESKHWISLSKQ